MRLDVSICGILACLSGLVGADGGDTSSAGTSTTSSTSNAMVELQDLKTPPVYTPSDGSQNLTYSFGQNISVEITAINLKRYSNNLTIATGKDFSTATSVGRRDDHDSHLPPVYFPIHNMSLTLVIPYDNTNFTTMWAIYNAEPLYYEFTWENSTAQGTSYSQLLAVAYDADVNAADSAIQSTQKGTNPVYAEVIQGSATDPISAGSSTGSTSPETSAASLTAGSSGNKGLSPGAIAGIAVGCAIAALLIIAFIVWFFYIRRRSDHGKKAGDPNFASGSGAGSRALVLDKEATGSPQSAYPDDGGRLRDPDAYASFEGARAGPPAPAPNAAFKNSSTDLASLGQASTTRAATPPPYQSRYAHLIEEGMTEDEIRNLEEEERHLDAAIEDAGRSSRRDTH